MRRKVSLTYIKNNIDYDEPINSGENAKWSLGMEDDSKFESLEGKSAS